MPTPLPPSSFGPLIDPLLDGLPPPLDAGEPNTLRRHLLAGLGPGDLCGGPVRNPDAADACLAGLWLWNGFFEESHALSQRLHTAEGSWWHGILHRREGDFGNAAYWFRRIGDHPLLPVLGRCVARLVPDGAATGEAAFLGSGRSWDPCRFTTLCESLAGKGHPVAGRGLAASDSNDLWRLARRAAEAEWRMLFAACLSRARGEG